MYYELINGQLFSVEKIETINQTAVVKTAIEVVEGYPFFEPIRFDNIPIKQEIPNKTSNLHYENCELVWIYKDINKTKDEELLERVSDIEQALAAILGGAL